MAVVGLGNTDELVREVMADVTVSDNKLALLGVEKVMAAILNYK